MATPLQGIAVPSLSDPPNGPAQMLALGTGLEKLTVMRFASAAARTAAITAPEEGMVTYLTDTNVWYGYDGSAWVPISGPVAWTAVSFQNSWVDYDGSRLCQYRRIGDIVCVRGTMKSGTLAAVAFTLPSGFRPPQIQSFAVATAGGFGYLDISTDGTVTAATANQTWTSLNGVHFSVT